MLFFWEVYFISGGGTAALFFVLGQGEAYVTWGPWISAIALMLWLLMDVDKIRRGAVADPVSAVQIPSDPFIDFFSPKDGYTALLRCFPTSALPVKVIRMQQQIQRQGVLYALGALPYPLGLAPHLLQDALRRAGRRDLTHRMIWSCAPADGAGPNSGRQWHKVQAVLRQPRVLLTLAFTSVTVGGNWLLFIWAINNGPHAGCEPGLLHQPVQYCCSACCS